MQSSWGGGLLTLLCSGMLIWYIYDQLTGLRETLHEKEVTVPLSEWEHSKATLNRFIKMGFAPPEVEVYVEHTRKNEVMGGWVPMTIMYEQNNAENFEKDVWNTKFTVQGEMSRDYIDWKVDIERSFM